MGLTCSTGASSAAAKSCARRTTSSASARLQLASEAEAERRRIARDLHDQTLADLRRLLLLTDEMQRNDAPAQVTGGGMIQTTTASAVDPSELRAEIESISQEVRRICEDLSPSVLENVGFAAALEWALSGAVAHTPEGRKVRVRVQL